MKKLLMVFFLVGFLGFISSCSDEEIYEDMKEQNCCGEDEDDLPPPPPPPPSGG